MSQELTILDYLNEDCWRLVLDRVPVRDVIRSQRVSRQWQNAMLVYLSNVQVNIVHPALDDREYYPHDAKLPLKKADWSPFITWTSKVGASVMSTYCDSDEHLETLAEVWPNLTALTFYELQEQYVEYDELVTLNDNFKFLQRLSFNICFVSDYFITKFIANRALEELKFSGNHKVTGSFLNRIKLTNLKTLIFKNCKRLNFDFSSIVDSLTGIKKLDLNYVPWSFIQSVMPVLHKMNNLVSLEVILCFENTDVMFFEYVSNLSRLKHLNVNVEATDEDLELLSVSCTELRSLTLATCTRVSGRGVMALCSNAGERLTTLGLKCSRLLTNCNVLTIIVACPNLASLDVSGSTQVTYALLIRAKYVWSMLRRNNTLRLRILHSTFTLDRTTKYEEIFPETLLDDLGPDEDDFTYWLQTNHEEIFPDPLPDDFRTDEDDFIYWSMPERPESPTYANLPNYFALIAGSR